MVPNRLADVEQCKRDYPEAWAHAHTGSARTEEFIRLLAARLHASDPRFGLNGKRGNPHDLSDDCVNYKGEGPGHDPTANNQPVTVIDVIAAAGSPEARPTWQVFDTLPGPGAWVQPPALPTPTPVPAPTPAPTPAPVPALACACAGESLGARLDALAHAIEDLRQQVAAIPVPAPPDAPSYPIYEGKLWGVIVRLRPVGPAKDLR